MIENVSVDELAGRVSSTVREKLNNKKIPLENLNYFLEDIANQIKDIEGFKAKWAFDKEAFLKHETTLFVKSLAMCTYQIKFDNNENVFIATEVRN
ncbi:hypothetical protein [Listeria booriae]|uniref:hypothetical protein n=1 Tax=Listeria booriae TaxID=1552123 RepID=UPI001624A9BB|nr:hypothetical protein [Listeria booriae]MBC2676236.1 hypothetical protein [Listeria booriae]